MKSYPHSSTSNRSVLFNGKFLLKLQKASPRLVLALQCIEEIQWDSTIKCWWVPAESIFEIASLIEGEASTAAQRLRSDPRYEEVRAKASAYQAVFSASSAIDSDMDIPVPKGLAYLGYQKAGIQYALEKEQCLIADEMGLGKTIQALGIINQLTATMGKVPRILIVSPVIVKTNWYRETLKWLTQKCSVLLVDAKTNPAIIARHTIVIINYDILYKFQDILTSIDWDLLVGDEAHKIKNAESRRSIVFREISYFAERRVLMTGTPIMNRPSELWHLLHILNPEEWNNFFEFTYRYCDAKKGAFGWNVSGVRNARELSQRLRESCMVRRLKKDVLKELPAKRRQIVEISGKGFEKKLQAERAILQRYKKKFDKFMSDTENLEANLRYTSIGTENVEVYKNTVNDLKTISLGGLAEIARIRKATAIAKLPKVVEFIKDVLETKDKIVVMAHHRDVVDSIVKTFGKAAVKVQGGQSPAERQVSVDRFRKDPAIRVFVGSISAAGEGITLTESDTVIFAELAWTPAEMTQAEDRCHRIGQKDVVSIYHLVVENSIDAIIAKKLVNKQDIIDKVLETKPRKKL